MLILINAFHFHCHYITITSAASPHSTSLTGQTTHYSKHLKTYKISPYLSKGNIPEHLVYTSMGLVLFLSTILSIEPHHVLQPWTPHTSRHRFTPKHSLSGCWSYIFPKCNRTGLEGWSGNNNLSASPKFSKLLLSYLIFEKL